VSATLTPKQWRSYTVFATLRSECVGDGVEGCSGEMLPVEAGRGGSEEDTAFPPAQRYEVHTVQE